VPDRLLAGFAGYSASVEWLVEPTNDRVVWANLMGSITGLVRPGSHHVGLLEHRGRLGNPHGLSRTGDLPHGARLRARLRSFA
jgi:hypothetical protein